MKVIIPVPEKLLENLNLNTEGQKKLIELLILTGSILVALKLPDSMIGVFMLFILTAIIYYIRVWKGSQTQRLIPLIVSCTFSAIVTIVLVMNMNIPFLYLKVIMFTFYYAAFTIIIWIALIRR